MAHKVLLMSPLHNMGSTVASALLAQGLTFSNKTVTLLFTQAESLLPSYFGIQSAADPTRSVMQIVKLIDNGAISDKDILDYTYSLAKNCSLLNVADKSLTDKDRTQVVTHVYNRSATNIVVVDNSDDLETNFSRTLIEESDTIFIVIQPTAKCFQRLKLWVQNPILKDNPNVYVIVNCYNEVIFAARNMAKHIGFPANRVCKIHYNPWIAKCCFSGTLQTVLPLAKDLDPRVANLSNDIKELQQCIDGAIIMQSKKGF
ncbi:MAG: hypothetical protein NC548_11400 [Lachnospiraceae bacterium]|nr:hypothetical protein [Lachnospiraceae bacterium]